MMPPMLARVRLQSAQREMLVAAVRRHAEDSKRCALSTVESPMREFSGALVHARTDGIDEWNAYRDSKQNEHPYWHSVLVRTARYGGWVARFHFLQPAGETLEPANAAVVARSPSSELEKVQLRLRDELCDVIGVHQLARILAADRQVADVSAAAKSPQESVTVNPRS